MFSIMCGVQLADGVNTKELMVKLGLVSTTVEVEKQGSLRWLGYVVNKGGDDCVKHESLRLKVVEGGEGQG